MADPSGNGGSEPTFYETLGVEEDASAAEVRAAYRERAKDTHPDVSDAADAGRRFRRLKRAHDVLADEHERRRYDRLGHGAYIALDDHGRSGTGREASSGAPRTGDRTEGSSRGRRAAGSRSTSGRRGGYDTTGHGRGGSGTDSGGTATEQEAFGRFAYGLARWLGFAGALVGAWQSRIGPTGAATALATFAAYPVFLASTVTPLFPLGVNLLVGLCTLAMLGYLIARPEIGIAVLGAWLLVLPVALTVSGVGVVSLGGLYVLVATGVPLVLCVATLLGVSA
ncbi:MAG: DnaJ domain-containing protein [Haloarculaceae archaeon]